MYAVLKKKPQSLRVSAFKGSSYFSSPGAKVPMYQKVFSHSGEADTRKALMASSL